MKRILLSLAVCVFVCFCSIVYAPSASASWVPSVQLTVEQTLGLYGYQIQALYRNGADWASCTFQFAGASPIGFTALPFDFRGGHPSGYTSWSDYMNNGLMVRPQLWYVCKASDAPIANSSDFEFLINPQLQIQGVSFYRQNFCFSKVNSNSSQYGNSISNVFLNTQVSFRNSGAISYVKGWDGYDYGYFMCDDIGYNGSTMEHTPDLVRYNLIETYIDNIVDGEQQPFNVGGQMLHYGRSGSYRIQDYEDADLYYILMVGCPIVTDGYVLPDAPPPDYSDSLQEIGTNISTQTTQLQQILAKLDLIYQNMSSTVDLSSSTISNIGTAIKNLFVPDSGNLISFKANLETALQGNMNPLLSMETIRDNVFSDIMNASPVGYVDLPLLDLRSAGIDFNLTAAEFSDFDVVDNKVRVPLKVQDSRWNWFYELVAWGIDVICTLAFINMCIHKIHAFFVGETVVETDDN